MTAVPLPRERDVLRDAYEDHMAGLYEQADRVTHGYMVNQVAAARGVKGVDIYWPWAGRASESCASSELRGAWDLGLVPRPLSFRQFRATNSPKREKNRMTDPMLDYAGAALLLGVKVKTVREYRARGWLPEPDLVVSGRPAWKQSTLRKWDERRKAVNAAAVHVPVDWSNVEF